MLNQLKYMNILRFLLLFIFFNFNFLIAAETLPFNNIVLHKNPLQVSHVKFKDFDLKDIQINKKDGKIKVLNFWATWCAPCKKEMPSLDQLQSKEADIEVFAINMEKPNQKKTKQFLRDLNVNNLKIYFDPNFELVKQFKIKGVPTTIILNKNGNELARIIGEIDFNNKKFIKWINQFK